MASTEVYPLAVTFATLSLLVVLLDLPPVVWHYKRQNWPFFSLILWIILLNLFNFLNAVLWPSAASVDPATAPNYYHGQGLCDVEVKIIIGSYVGLPCAFVAIMRSLAHVLDTDRINLAPSRAQKMRELAIQFSLTWLPPVFLMSFHYIVQSNRYYLWSISGCNPSADNSWPTMWLIFIWPALFSVVDSYYAILLLVRIYRYRKEFNSILAASSTTRSRFLRPLIMSLILIFAVVPLSFWILANNLTYGLHPYSFGTLHDPKTWNTIDYGDFDGQIVFDRWIRVAAGVLVFLFFGTGQDAVTMYKSWMIKVGLGKMFPSLNQSRTMSRSTRSSRRTYTWNSVTNKTKQLFSYHTRSESSGSELPMTAATVSTKGDTVDSRVSASAGAPRVSIASSSLEPMTPSKHSGDFQEFMRTNDFLSTERGQATV